MFYDSGLGSIAFAVEDRYHRVDQNPITKSVLVWPGELKGELPEATLTTGK